jgi:hypothetical protein
MFASIIAVRDKLHLPASSTFLRQGCRDVTWRAGGRVGIAIQARLMQVRADLCAVTGALYWQCIANVANLISPQMILFAQGQGGDLRRVTGLRLLSRSPEPLSSRQKTQQQNEDAGISELGLQVRIPALPSVRARVLSVCVCTSLLRCQI